MAIRKYELSDEQMLTEEQIHMVKEAEERPVVLDDDNPELTDEQLASFRKVHERRQADRRRHCV